MLKRVDASKFGSVKELSDEVVKDWASCKVLLVTNVDPKSPESLRAYYDELLETVGTPMDLGETAIGVDRHEARTGARWTEIRYDPSIANAYRHSANAHPLHTDGSYVPTFPDASMLYCVSSAGEGGATVFLDSTDLIDILKQDDPELLQRLEAEEVVHERSGDRRVCKIIEHDEKGVLLNWNYTCVSESSDERVLKLREDFHEFLNNNDHIKEKLVGVKMQPGDCVLFEDRRLLHGRNSFNPKVASERFIWKTGVQVHAA